MDANASPAATPVATDPNDPTYDPLKDPAHYGSLVARARMLYATYGVTLDYYDRLLAAQDYLCRLCHSPHHPERPLVVDHNHATGKVRGLLCSECNTALGLFGDNPDVLAEAVAYLAEVGDYAHSGLSSTTGPATPEE